MRVRILSALLACSLVTVTAVRAQEAPELVKAGQALLQKGNVDEAVGKFREATAADPQLYAAHYELGCALDLQGHYTEARQQLEQAISLAPETSRNDALSAMAVSYAFEAKPDDAARYYQRVFDALTQANDAAAAAATANALGRIYLESGRVEKAEEWYRTGYETSKRLSHRGQSQQTLWEIRWEHALARIAARRGQREQALRHAATVKALLAKGLNPDQRPFYPYLLGYIDFFTRQYRSAIVQLGAGDQTDPFVLGLIARAEEKLGERTRARQYYTRVMAVTSHSINTAFSRPKAQAFLRRTGR